MSRPKKPTKQKEKQGTLRKNRANNREPTIEVVIPPCPKILGKEGKKEWKRITKELKTMQIIAKIDASALTIYCRAYENWLDCEQKIIDASKPEETADGIKQKDGKVSTSSKGISYINANVSLSSMYVKQMTKILTEFGMTPASRAKVNAEGPSKEDSFLDYLKDKK